MRDIIHVVAHIEAKAGSEAAVREVLESYLVPTRAEKGCIRYDLFLDVQEPGAFTFIEEWESMDDLIAHSKSAHLVRGRALLADLTAKPAWVQKAKQIG